MNHVLYQTSGLLRFLNSLGSKIDNIQYNKLDTDLKFVSKFYTPNIQLSELSKKVLQDIKQGNIKTAERDYDNNSLVKKVEDTSLSTDEPKMYILLQTIIMEAYAIVNCFVENPDFLKYISDKDIKVTRENTNYVADYLSNFSEYSSIVKDLRELDICFGYIELQLPLVKREQGL